MPQFSLFTRKDLFSHATFSKDKEHFGFVLFVPSKTRLLYIGSRQANTVLEGINSEGINVATESE